MEFKNIKAHFVDAPKGAEFYNLDLKAIDKYYRNVDEEWQYWDKTDECWIMSGNADTWFMSHLIPIPPSIDLEPESPQSASDYLNACLAVQTERGEQYDSEGGERSFQAVATAFNAITGKELKGSDICLVLQLLKDVRQYSNPNRLHEDSVLDKVSYASLHAEELTKELTNSKEKEDV